MIMSAMIIKWNELMCHSEFLILVFLARQDDLLFENSDIWFCFFWNLKIYSITQQQQLEINEICILKIYKKAMINSEAIK